MLVQRGYELAEPVMVEGEDPDIVRQFLGAREQARLVETGTGNAENIQTVYESLSEIYLYLVEDRAPP
jgi:hypothetical protein